ncbi:MAG: hypothetical protein HKN89_05285 [Eudoraea sp.]|nr:hypothetical protein [Eudoraea sp.]
MNIIRMPLYVHPARLVLPVIAMVLFIVFYVIAALNYPGGSWNDTSHVGFSFWNNYLCDLLDTYAINGSLNTGRLWSRTGLAILCAGLVYLWYHLPILFARRGWTTKIMWISGLLAFVSLLTLSEGTHDISVRVAGLFGTVALIALVVELMRYGYIRLYPLGIICIVIFLVNYGIYETGKGLRFLPVFQKVTFTLFFLWFFQINRILAKVNRQMHPLKAGGRRHKIS